MKIATDDGLAYYAEHGTISDPASFARQLQKLPSDISPLCGIVQGLLIHVFWAERYGEKISQERKAEVGIRHVETILEKIQRIDGGPITESRPLDKRFVGNCRTFSVLLTAMLRSQGIPARARCGFGRYFTKGWFEDHWVCEYWNQDQSRWIMVDAQLDEFQCRALKVKFDPLDVPRDRFIVGGKAWLSCRNDETHPDKFGIFDMRGLWFIRGNLVRDVASLNKVELLPWDGWGLIDHEDSDISSEELTFLDNVALMTFDKVDFFGIQEAYETSEGLAVPQVINSYTQSGLLRIDLSTEEVVD